MDSCLTPRKRPRGPPRWSSRPLFHLLGNLLCLLVAGVPLQPMGTHKISAPAPRNRLAETLPHSQDVSCISAHGGRLQALPASGTHSLLLPALGT